MKPALEAIVSSLAADPAELSAAVVAAAVDDHWWHRGRGWYRGYAVRKLLGKAATAWLTPG